MIQCTICVNLRKILTLLEKNEDLCKAEPGSAQMFVNDNRYKHETFCKHF